MDFPGSSIGEFYGEVYRHGLAAFVDDDHVSAFFMPQSGNGQIRISSVIKPASPEPVQVPARSSIHAAKEIQRSRMFAAPIPDIPVQPLQEQAVPQQVFDIEITQRRFRIGIEVIVVALFLGRGRDDGQVIFLAGALRIRVYAIFVDQAGVDHAVRSAIPRSSPILHPSRHI